MTAVVKFGLTGSEVQRRDLNDNAVEYIVVGDRLVDRMIELEYSFELSVSGRAHVGHLILNHDGNSVVVDDEYVFVPPVIEGFSFGADFDGNYIRLVVTTNNVGENPTIKYRRNAIGVV